MYSIDNITRRIRTQKTWDAMRRRFFAEWSDGCETVREHQFRWSETNGFVDASQINEWFAAHGKRQIEERWPEYKNEKEELA